uniref:Uncharacterized protein n=1 Tax=viral metagenome TaxID=1070528 RepID=A0A6C0J9C6_9ZZZZ
MFYPIPIEDISSTCNYIILKQISICIEVTIILCITLVFIILS